MGVLVIGYWAIGYWVSIGYLNNVITQKPFNQYLTDLLQRLHPIPDQLQPIFCQMRLRMVLHSKYG